MRWTRIFAAFALAASATVTLIAQQQQQGTITATENLVIDGVPPIPASLADEVRRYTEARPAALADWHPLEREMLISTRFANTAQIHRVKTPGGARTQLTFFNEPVRSAAFEPIRGRYFIFGKDVGGNEFEQLYRYDFGDGKITLLTDGGRSQNGGVTWSRTGDRIAYGSTRRNGSDRDIYVMDPANASSDRLVLEVSGGGWHAVDWSPSDDRLLIIEFLSISKTNIHLLDLASGHRAPLTPSAEHVASLGAAFSADGKGVYVASDRDSEFQHLGYIDIATKQYTALTADLKWDVEAFDLSHDGTTIAVAMNEAGVSKLYFFDTASKRIRPVTRAPSGVIGAIRWHRNNRDVALSVGSARSTSDVYSLDVADGEVTRWTEGELGGVIAAELSEPELIRWKSFDGLEISGFMYRPLAKFTGKRPVIINIHGGPEGQARPTFLGRNNYFVNELGIAMIYPNVRGSTGFGKKFVGLDHGLKREDSVKDIGALLDWIATHPTLDAGRVMVMGGSYGGYMTLAASTHYSSRLKAAVDIVGISNFATFLKNTESYRRDLRRPEYGDERDPEMARFFERIAPLNNARRIAHPLFVVQGGNDPRVPLTEAQQMVARVKENGKPVWYLMAKDEGHGFAKKSNADFQFYATVMFVRRYLLDEAAGTK